MLAAVVGVAVVLQNTSGAACAAAIPGRAHAAPPVGDTVHRGKATYYSTSGGGNCSYPGPPADGLFVALSPAEYAGAAGCGGYLDVTGPKGKVRVKIVDQCPGCAAGHIDLSRKAFARIADLAQGVAQVSYRAVINPPLSGSLTFRFKDGASRWWFALLVDNHGNPLRTVQVRAAANGWKSASRADYNYWLIENGLGPGPFDIRVTDVYGQSATVTGVRLAPERDQRSGVFLYGRSAPGRTTPGGTTPGTPSPAGGVASSPAGTAATTAVPTPVGSGSAAPSASPSRDDC